MTLIPELIEGSSGRMESLLLVILCLISRELIYMRIRDLFMIDK